MFYGVIVNTLAVLVGGIIGTLVKKAVSEKTSSDIISALGLCTVFVAIDGLTGGGTILVAIVSLSVGTLVGSLLNLENAFDAFGKKLCAKFDNSQEGNVGHAFVSASLLMCVGAMTIVGALNAGISGDNTLLYTKSVLDFVTAIMLGASLGWGVCLAAAVVFVLEGGLTCLASLLQPLVQSNPQMITELTFVGSLIILGLGFNMLAKEKKVNVANMLPSIVLTPFALLAYQWIVSLI